jgi:uracil-DNA glycosylase
MTQLYDLAEDIRRCTSCPLWKDRTLAVPGDRKGKVVMVFSHPSEEEDRLGTLIVEDCSLLEKLGLSKDDCFFTTLLKCYPKNVVDLDEHYATCKSLWLDKQIEAINPHVVIVDYKLKNYFSEEYFFVDFNNLNQETIKRIKQKL